MCGDCDCDSAAAIILAIALKRKREKRKIKRVCLRRLKLGNSELLKELEYTSQDDYKQYLRMDTNTFEDLLARIGQLITKKDTLMREAISARHRLLTTLRFLVTGKSYSDLHDVIGISAQSIGYIVMETCEAIIKSLEDCIKLPRNENEWRAEARVFGGKWNFPNCIGVLGGRHIAITKPLGSGMTYYNDKRFFSVILMAAVNANHQFLMVDVGTPGGISETGLCRETNFLAKLQNRQLKLPPPDYLPLWNGDNDEKMPFVFLGDESFPLHENLMKPFSSCSTKRHEVIFNYRLSRAARTLENVLGMLASRFRVLLTTINLPVQKATTITMACCFLHNYLIQRKERLYYMGGFNIENKEMRYADWHGECMLTGLSPTTIGDTDVKGNDRRNQLTKYFNTAGEVKWQGKAYQKLVNKTRPIKLK